MISGIQLHNYQSHALSRFSLAPGVNAIVGPSDSGKSAILRALSWLATNRPAGEGSRKHGSENGWGIVVQIEDGTAVTRCRGEAETGGVNSYAVTPKQGEAKVYEAMGQDVPADVAKLLRLPPLCFQRQMDPPYLLSESAGEFARRLNEVAGLDVLDRAQSNIARAVREEDRRVLDEESAVASAKTDFDALQWVPLAAGLLQGAESMEKELAGSRERYIKVTHVAQASDVLCSQLDALPDWKSFATRIAKAEAQSAQITEIRRTTSSVRERLSAIASLKAHVQRVAAEVERDSAMIEKLMPKECPLCGSKINE
jgi:exonuclease SbcC